MLTTLYIVLPCFNEQEVLPSTLDVLLKLLASMQSSGAVSEDSCILCVDDGSRDTTWEVISVWAGKSPHIRGVKLAGNAGHQNALMAGLSVAVEKADALVTIDADLQDDENVISQMVTEYRNGADIVCGVRKARTTDTWFKRNTAQAFYRLMGALGVKTVYNHADYRLMSRRAVKQLLQYRERNLFLRGIVPLIGYKTACVYYDRKERTLGESKYPLSKMLNFAVDGITSFSVKPVRMVFFLGVAFLFVALAILIYVLYEYFTANVVPGWSSLILSVWFIGGCILLGLGIVGEYIGKIYIEVKDRPRYNIETII